MLYKPTQVHVRFKDPFTEPLISTKFAFTIAAFMSNNRILLQNIQKSVEFLVNIIANTVPENRREGTVAMHFLPSTL